MLQYYRDPGADIVARKAIQEIGVTTARRSLATPAA